MGRDALKSVENMYARCRKQASKYNEKLYSREGAAEALGVHPSTLANYELDITKVVPSDMVVLMADLYKTPELMAWYCTSECPIGKGLNMPRYDVSSVERTTLKLLKRMKASSIEETKEKLISITDDGVIDEEEKPKLEEIMKFLEELIKAAGELKLIGEKILGEK